ncbi:MAG: ribose-5-phosphate isomerase RpiA [Trueperaceae bacterium]
MTRASDDASAQKRAAAEAALAEVRPHTVLGLGTGSTAHAFLLALGARIAAGELPGVRGVATSRATERTSRELGIELIDLPADGVDLAVDGMDEIDPELDVIKGLGGALLREKIVAASAARFVLIGDAGKRVPRLGTRCPLPVEVLAFGADRTQALLSDLGLAPTVRGGPSEPFLSDNGHPLLDCKLPAGFDPWTLAQDLDALPGVVGHGLFLGMADAAYLADGSHVQRIDRAEGA